MPAEANLLTFYSDRPASIHIKRGLADVRRFLAHSAPAVRPIDLISQAFPGEIMNKSIRVVAVTVLLTTVLPAANAQQADPPKQSMTAKLKHKYQERRAKLMSHVKAVSFAVGCKVLADSYLAYVAENGLNDDAMQEGLARAAKPGACDYYRRHPEAAAAIRRIAAEGTKQE